MERGRSVEHVVRSITTPLQLVGGVLVTTLTIVNIWDQIRLTRAILRRMSSSSGALTDVDSPYAERDIGANVNDLRLEALNSVITTTATQSQSCVTWEKIAGLKPVKIILQESTVLPILRPDLFQGVRQPPRGILLFGPPGSGKTMLARAVATESRATFIAVTGSNILSMWVGESEQNVKGLFEKARKQQPSVIFIDEVDSLLSKRNGARADSSHDRRVTNEFLAFIDGIQMGQDGSRVVVIAATNNPWDLDEAALSRFSRRIYVPLPDKFTRAELIRKTMTGVPMSVSDAELLKVAEMTGTYSGRDLVQVCREASMRPLRELWGERLLESSTSHHLTERKLVEAVAGFLASGTPRKRIRRSLEHWKRKTRSTWCDLDAVITQAQAHLQRQQATADNKDKGKDQAGSAGQAASGSQPPQQQAAGQASAAALKLGEAAQVAAASSTGSSVGAGKDEGKAKVEIRSQVEECGAAGVATCLLESVQPKPCSLSAHDTCASFELTCADCDPLSDSDLGASCCEIAESSEAASPPLTSSSNWGSSSDLATTTTTSCSQDSTPSCPLQAHGATVTSVAAVAVATLQSAAAVTNPPTSTCTTKKTTCASTTTSTTTSLVAKTTTAAPLATSATTTTTTKFSGDESWSVKELLQLSCDTLREVVMSDFENALKCIMSTELDLTSRYVEWNGQYGSGSDVKSSHASAYSSMYI